MTPFTGNTKSRFEGIDTLQKLLFINIAVFVIIRLINTVSTLFNTPVFEFDDVSAWLAVPASPGRLLAHPWTLITYMFYHWNFLHLFFNMLWLFYMGKIFMEYLGQKKLRTVYLLGGISGAILYIVSYNVFPLFANIRNVASALGASASVLAITAAAATLVPDYPMQLFIFGSVKLKYIALIVILSDLISLSGSNAGGHIAHLGGALFGFVYIWNYKKGINTGTWPASVPGIFKKKKKTGVRVYNNRTVPDDEYLKNKRESQEKLDEILDKISKSGYGSLTQEEKDFLFNASRKDS
ncbi:MAG: rhomboid family intramembrane serine protease [Bacteroidia bacterium]|nr:rhomboid family intramembrane serine protease [Bacteroidia bacterium]